MVIKRYAATEKLSKTNRIDSDIESARWLTDDPDEVYEILSTLKPKDLTPEQSDRVRAILQETIDHSAEHGKTGIQHLRDLFKNKSGTPAKNTPHKKVSKIKKPSQNTAPSVKQKKPADQCDFDNCLSIIDSGIEKKNFTEICAYIDRLDDLGKGSIAFRKYFEVATAAYLGLPAEMQQALKEGVAKTVSFAQEDHPKDSHITFTIAKWYERSGQSERAREFFNATSPNDFNGKKKEAFKQHLIRFSECHPTQG